MKGNIGIIIAIIVIAIGVMFYFQITPNNKLYESQSYGFKTEYPGTWQEIGGESPKVVTFIDELSTDFKTNTDVYVYSNSECVDMSHNLIIDITGAARAVIMDTDVKLAGKTAEKTQQIRVDLNNQTYYFEILCVEHAEHVYLLVNFAKDFGKQAKNFDIIKNSFAFTAISPEQFGGVGDLLSGLRQKYQESVPFTKTFEWTEGEETHTYTITFTGEGIVTSGDTPFDFITNDPLLQDFEIAKGKQTDETVDLKYQNNLGYVTETITKTYDKLTGMPVKITVESDAGSFEIDLNEVENGV